MSGLRFVMGEGGGPPVGSYEAEFIRAEEFSDNVEKYGVGVKLVWKVLSGDHTDEEASRICSAKLNKKTNLYGFVVALNGGPIEPGQEVELTKFYGTRGMLIVEEMDSGSTRVSTFLKQG